MSDLADVVAERDAWRARAEQLDADCDEWKARTETAEAERDAAVSRAAAHDTARAEEGRRCAKAILDLCAERDRLAAALVTLRDAALPHVRSEVAIIARVLAERGAK